jgi:hypothetical protein
MLIIRVEMWEGRSVELKRRRLTPVGLRTSAWVARPVNPPGKGRGRR